MNKKMQIVVMCLLTVLMLTVLIGPSLAAEQVQSAGQIHPSSVYSDQDISKSFDSHFLNLFGYNYSNAIGYSATATANGENAVGVYSVKEGGKATTVSVKNNLYINDVANDKSYDYNAQFYTSDGKIFSVVQSYSETKNANMTTSVGAEKVAGAMKYASFVSQNKTLGPVVQEQMAGSYQVGDTSANFTFAGIIDNSQSYILNGTMNLNQNMYEPFGNYSFSFSPDSTQLGSGSKFTITFPNGTQIDPGINQFANGLWSGSSDLYGWYIWWEAINDDYVHIILFGLTLAVTLIPCLLEFEPIVDNLDYLALAAYPYASSMGPGNYIMYFNAVLWLGFIPVYGEAGFYTDTYLYVPLGNWYYIPLVPIPLAFHTTMWPIFSAPDPPLTALAYDESSSSYVSGLPLTINSTWNQLSGSTCELAPGTYTILAPNDGSAFDYFDVGGTAVYDNPATITVTEDTTVTMCYHYTPCSWLTVSYYDFGNNWLSSDSQYLPWGTYVIYPYNGSFWDEYYQVYVMPVGTASIVTLISDTEIFYQCTY